MSNPFVVKDTTSNFKPAPSGAHMAVCVDLVDLGVVKSAFGEARKIRVYWQIEEVDDETGRPFIVSNMYTPSLNEKANLRKHLESWRGRAFTPEELKGFDLEKLLGANCQLNVIHVVKDGTTYANIAAIMPPPKSAAKLAPRDYVRVKDRKKDDHPEEPFQATDSDVPF